MRLPPLNPLRVFEVVARTHSLTAAAAELHVTQSAVSRQIAVLENYLGVELITREHRGVALTRKGEAYARHIKPALGAIADATDLTMRDTTQGALRVITYTTFAGKWLVPRLHDFKRLHPNIEIKVSTSVSTVDFDHDQADVAVQYGDGQWPRLQADLLFEDEFEPICSPHYLERADRHLDRTEDLLRHRLLVSHYRRADWEDWLSATGLTACAQSAERMTFSTSLLTWQAAMDGLGLAIGQTALLHSELAAGLIVRPFHRPVRRTKGHYLIRPKVQRESRKVRAFRDWLLAGTREAREAMSRQ
ncbi:transcriptional regulator GcvA [Verticiella sediminum]|uniref:Transcriptional regulator GcvA n=1 Tax=Verticiella sediminum TaxID=1247510 RepID=A0A556A7Y9_9BURK|nr:transcriptional regulator GcvA [Verticiella sediminum]TSH89002.1 transcriptional regulator GcvA [Verticiella sediminum]